MGRVKPQNPQRLTGDECRARSWNQHDDVAQAIQTVKLLTGLGDAPPLNRFLPDFDDEEDVEFVPIQRKRKNVKAKCVKIDAALERKLSSASCYLDIAIDDFEPWACKLGQFDLRLHDKLSFSAFSREHFETFWLYLGSERSDRSFLYFEAADKGYFTVDCTMESHWDTLSALSRTTKAIHLHAVVNSKECVSADILTIKLGFKGSAFHQLRHASDDPMADGARRSLQRLMNAFVATTRYQDYEIVSQKRENLAELYRSLKAHQRSSLADCFNQMKFVDPQHPGLIPRLRRYQRDAVKWMMYREGLLDAHAGADPKHTAHHHPFYEPVVFACGTRAFYNKYGAILTKLRPLLTRPHCGGGILADEMGLGKTVEILALVLLNPKRKSVDKYLNKGDLVAEICDDGDSRIVGDVVENLIFEVAGRIDTENAFVKERILCSPKKRRFLPASSRRPALMELTNLASIPRNSALECLCGATPSHLHSTELGHLVQCHRCLSCQHSACVNWPWPPGPKSRIYLCPHCAVDAPPVKSGATLIISPSTICLQWFEEIKKHIRSDALNVHIYQGIAKERFVQPRVLASCDIVITTYETLRSEVQHLDLPNCQRFRKPKRFVNPPTPLTAINWWRICLDEAQMVEQTSTKAAAMCNRLTAVHRWCVTGTPIAKSVDDLYGLCVFLGVDPYWVRGWWQRVLLHPYLTGHEAPMLNLLAPLLWRSEKADVRDQMGIPEQDEKVFWLKFSPVEDNFYRRYHNTCGHAANQILAKFPNQALKLSDLARDDVTKLLRPLLGLRQACCHPQVVRGQFIALNKSTLSMEAVLLQLIKKSRIECEAEHRSFVAAQNGQAGIRILEERWADAAGLYRAVLQACDEYADRIRTDPLPKIHAGHNLTELIRHHRAEIAPTLRDDDLMRETNELKDKYLEKSLNVFERLKVDWAEQTTKVEGRVDELDSEAYIEWYSDVTAIADSEEIGLDLMQKVRSSLFTTMHAEFATQFNAATGVTYSIVTSWKALMDARKALFSVLESLRDTDLSDGVFLEKAHSCHLSKQRQDVKFNLTAVHDQASTSTKVTAKSVRRDMCDSCMASSFFDAYESKLFKAVEECDLRRGKDKPDDDPTRDDDNVDGEEITFDSHGATTLATDKEEVTLYGSIRQATWKDSALEVTLKAIEAFMRPIANKPLFEHVHIGRHKQRSLAECARLHLTAFELLKKEFRLMRAFWMGLEEVVAKRDELAMATERLRLRNSLDPPAYGSNQPINVVDPCTFALKINIFEADKVQARRLLERKLGNFLYLQNLKKVEQTLDGNPEPCPICQVELGHSWSVLTCGHCFCVDCIRIILNNIPFAALSVRCAICRQPSLKENVAYVVTKAERDKQEYCEKFPVRGSFSTKIEMIVRCLKQIKCESSNQMNAKALVFSNWHEVLGLLADAFQQNAIGFEQIKDTSTSRFQRAMTSFKTNVDVQVLLIPFSMGAKGLNIVEAKHVLLVEPLLNRADELQAIGRVHRIGQTEVTRVYRFLVKGTIEEKIESMMQEVVRDDASDEGCLTLNHLADLFKVDD